MSALRIQKQDYDVLVDHITKRNPDAAPRTLKPDAPSVSVVAPVAPVAEQTEIARLRGLLSSVAAELDDLARGTAHDDLFLVCAELETKNMGLVKQLRESKNRLATAETR